jgi:MFS family permease
LTRPRAKTSEQTRTVTRLYHGWLVVAAAFLIALFGWGTGFYGPGIYLMALQERHGWRIAEISSAITIYYLLGATLILFAGSLFERLGARRVVAAGAMAMACGVVLLTLIQEPWQVYAAFAVMSLGWAAMSGAAINIIVAPWFERRRGLAVSLALNGASAGGVLLAPLIILLMSGLGFSGALWCAALLMLAVLLPTAALVLRPKRASEHDRADDGSAARSLNEAVPAGSQPWRTAMALRDWRFLTIAIPFALGLTAQVGLLTHQVAYLTPLVGTVAAGWAVSLTTCAAIVGRIGTGALVDRVDRRAMACANFLLQVLALCILVRARSAPMLYLGCALFGLGVGNMISLPGLIVQQEFRRQDFARVVSLVVAVTQLTFAFGPALLGVLRQAGGSYTLPLVACLGMEALAAIIVVAPRLGAARSRS